MRDQATRRKLLAGRWITAGLIVQSVSFLWNAPGAFLLFALVGLPLVGVGVLVYVFSFTGGSSSSGGQDREVGSARG